MSTAVFVLYIYSIVAATPRDSIAVQDWVNRGEFTTEARCEHAGKTLARDRYKCLQK